MKSLTAVLYARVLEAEVRRSAKGRDYLSIKAEPLEEKTAAKIGAIWVTSFHKSHMAAGLKPGIQIRVEGPLDVQRYEAEGEKRIALWLTAEGLTFAVDASASPLAGAQAAGKKEASHSSRATKASARTENVSSASDPGYGSAITASLSEETQCQTLKPAQPAIIPAAVLDSISGILNSTQDGSASTVFEPKNKPKLPPEQIAALSMPAAKNTGKRHERPFDDALPF